MKTLRTSLAIAIAAFAVFATTARADVAIGNATANIVSGLSMSQATGNFLNFGKIVQPSVAGYVTVDVDNTRYTDIQVIPASTVSRAIFAVTGAPNSFFSIVLPTTSTLTRVGGPETMKIDTYVAKCGGSINGTGWIDLTSNATVYVGGTLRVGAHQALGEYDGTFTVTYAYN